MNIGDKIASKLSDKLNEKIGHRIDMYFADYQKMGGQDSAVAKVLIAYSNDTIPTTKDISEFFIHNFNGKVMPNLSTATLHKYQKAITILAELNSGTRRFEDTEKMRQVTADTWLDINMQEVWEVKSNQEGTKFLVRRSEDNINDILTARKNKMFIKSGLSFSQLAQGQLVTSTGDKVQFLATDGLVYTGVITSSSPTSLSISTENNKSFKVSPDAVIQIMEASDASRNALKKSIYDYQKKKYANSPDYAKDLTKNNPFL